MWCPPGSTFLTQRSLGLIAARENAIGAGVRGRSGGQRSSGSVSSDWYNSPLPMQCSKPTEKPTLGRRWIELPLTHSTHHPSAQRSASSLPLLLQQSAGKHPTPAPARPPLLAPTPCGRLLHWLQMSLRSLQTPTSPPSRPTAKQRHIRPSLTLRRATFSLTATPNSPIRLSRDTSGPRSSAEPALISSDGGRSLASGAETLSCAFLTERPRHTCARCQQGFG